MLHSSRLCDIVRCKQDASKERMRIHINRECKFFSRIVDYFYTGYMSLPKTDSDIHVGSMNEDEG